jgi:glycosyltransferase involved in cell wall biosynthesis
MARIFFINRFFFPDHSATSQMVSDLAFHLARRGHDIQVITSQQLYEDPRASLPERERIDGVQIHRIPTTRFGRSGLLGRAFDYLSFYALMWRDVRKLARRGDIIVAKTDPPLLCIPAMNAARQRGGLLVNWLQDVYPEVAMRMGVPLVKGRLGRALAHMRDASLRAAKANVVVGELMAETLRQRGITEDHIHVIPNWCNDEDIHPLPSSSNALRRKWGLGNYFVIGYSGNLGRVHEFDTVLAAAERLRNNSNILFLFIGGGKKFDELARHVRQRSLDHVFRFMPYQDRAVLKYSLAVPDVHLVSLRPELEGLIVPSKFYGVAAAGRPLIALTSREGEIAKLVYQHRCGLVVEPGDADGLVTAIRHLSQNDESLVAMGRRARRMLDTDFSRQQAFNRWSSVLEALA